MAKYRALQVMAIDSGRAAPRIDVSIFGGPDAAHACVARKKFALNQLSEVRDLISWSLEAYAAAFDEIHEEGWEVSHHVNCPKLREVCRGEA